MRWRLARRQKANPTLCKHIQAFPGSQHAIPTRASHFDSDAHALCAFIASLFTSTVLEPAGFEPGEAGDGVDADRPQPVLRFSAAHDPHDDRYAPALDDAACIVARACDMSGALETSRNSSAIQDARTAAWNGSRNIHRALAGDLSAREESEALATLASSCRFR